MTTKQTESNYVTPESIISALEYTNHERGELINDYAIENVKLRQMITKLTKIITMMKADIVETKQKLHEVVERHTL